MHGDDVGLPTEKINPRFVWDQPTVDLLRRFVERGITAKRIAEEFGVTRNTIIGKIYRHGFRGPRSLNPLLKFAEPTRDPFPAKGCCLWPHGHPNEPDFHFCGAEIARFGEPYCAAHRKRAWVPVP